MRPIKDAVHSDLEASRAVYDWVVEAVRVAGRGREATWCRSRNTPTRRCRSPRPSSAARALANGAPNIERVDRLVQTIAQSKGMQLDVVDQTVALVDGWLEKNRKKV